jgi:hypothetical protein
VLNKSSFGVVYKILRRDIMKRDFNEIREAVNVSGHLRRIENGLYHSFQPLGSYYAKNNINRTEEVKAYEERMMKLKAEIEAFRKYFEEKFLPNQ